MEDVLKELAEARRLAISLKHVQYSDQLVEQLMQHSQQLEKLYGSFQGLAGKESTKDSKFEQVILLAKQKMEWFEKSKASCD